MGVGGQDNKGIRRQRFMLVTEVEAFGQDEAGFCGEENGQTVNDGTRQKTSPQQGG